MEHTSGRPALHRPRKLTPTDLVDGFSCGNESLDRWISAYALVNQRSGMSSCYVITDTDARVVGYYALATAGLSLVAAPERVRRGVPRHDIPALILARLAVDSQFRGMGIGGLLVRDAMIRTLNVADTVGVRCLLVHAKDEEAKAFYMRIAEFEESPTDPLHLTLLMKDLRTSMDR